MTKTWNEWQNILSSKTLEAFEDVTMYPKMHYTAEDIMDRVVRYRGGVATGTEIRRLVAEIYGVALHGLTAYVLCDTGDYREEFVEGVYDLLSGDPTNDRANQIIDLYDRAPQVVGWVAE